MSSSNIYTGVWTNYAQGRVYGATITLTNAQAIALVSFLAILIINTGARSFKILKFILHQTRPHETLRDGLARQQDVVLRNGETDMGTLPLIPWIAYKWRGHAPNPYRRSLVLFFLLLIHTIAFLTAGIATSFVADGIDSMIIAKGKQCGVWVSADRSVESVSWWQRSSLKGTTATRAYARFCYDDLDTKNERRTPQSECRVFPRERLMWKGTHNASCPFKDGICLEGDTAAYTLDTGLQSSEELGINSPHTIQWQHRTTCGPLKTEGYVEERKGDGKLGEDVTYYYYGPVGMIGNSTNWISEFQRITGDGYALNIQTSAPWIGNGTLQLDPIPALRRDDGDVTLLFLTAYGISYYEPIEDPMFSAHQRRSPFEMPSFDEFPIYVADNPTTVLGCVDQYRTCNSRTGACSPYVPSNDPQSLLFDGIANNKGEEDVIILLRFHIIQMSIYMQGIGTGASVLAINDNVYANAANNLAREQWKVEAAHLFSLGLAGAQVAIVSAARESYPHPRGPLANILPSQFHHICGMIMFREPGYTSISVFGLFLILSSSVVITLVSFLDGVGGRCMRRRWPHQVLAWQMDATLQLLRLTYEGKRIGKWDYRRGAVPVTQMGEKLGVFEIVAGKVGIGRRPSGISLIEMKVPDEFGPGSEGSDV